MIKQQKLKACAKINLFLEVVGRREDGYHELQTVMQSVSLYDELTVSYDPEGSGIALSCDRRHIPCDKTNVAYKCAQAFFDRTGARGGVEIHISKRIPVAAGLGGGSADGAAVLCALNALTGARLDKEELCALGAKVGADIPFCVRGGCALAEGIGEIFTPLPVLSGQRLVIAIGSRGSSTPAAYKALDGIGYQAQRSSDNIVAAIREGSAKKVCAELYNAFERVVYPENADAETIRKELIARGASGALLSGSGASVFGLFENAQCAKNACAALREKGFFAVTAEFVG